MVLELILDLFKMIVFLLQEVHNVIKTYGLFGEGKKVAIGASGGKDSTVLIHVLNKLNRKHDYGLDIILLSIDEGITVLFWLIFSEFMYKCLHQNVVLYLYNLAFSTRNF